MFLENKIHKMFRSFVQASFLLFVILPVKSFALVGVDVPAGAFTSGDLLSKTSDLNASQIKVIKEAASVAVSESGVVQYPKGLPGLERWASATQELSKKLVERTYEYKVEPRYVRERGGFGPSKSFGHYKKLGAVNDVQANYAQATLLLIYHLGLLKRLAEIEEDKTAKFPADLITAVQRYADIWKGAYLRHCTRVAKSLSKDTVSNPSACQNALNVMFYQLAYIQAWSKFKDIPPSVYVALAAVGDHLELRPGDDPQVLNKLQPINDMRPVADERYFSALNIADHPIPPPPALYSGIYKVGPEWLKATPTLARALEATRRDSVDRPKDIYLNGRLIERAQISGLVTEEIARIAGTTSAAGASAGRSAPKRNETAPLRPAAAAPIPEEDRRILIRALPFLNQGLEHFGDSADKFVTKFKTQEGVLGEFSGRVQLTIVDAGAVLPESDPLQKTSLFISINPSHPDELLVESKSVSSIRSRYGLVYSTFRTYSYKLNAAAAVNFPNEITFYSGKVEIKKYSNVGQATVAINDFFPITR